MLDKKYYKYSLGNLMRAVSIDLVGLTAEEKKKVEKADKLLPDIKFNGNKIISLADSTEILGDKRIYELSEAQQYHYMGYDYDYGKKIINNIISNNSQTYIQIMMKYTSNYQFKTTSYAALTQFGNREQDNTYKVMYSDEKRNVIMVDERHPENIKDAYIVLGITNRQAAKIVREKCIKDSSVADRVNEMREKYMKQYNRG